VEKQVERTFEHIKLDAIFGHFRGPRTSGCGRGNLRERRQGWQRQRRRLLWRIWTLPPKRVGRDSVEPLQRSKFSGSGLKQAKIGS